MSHIIIIIIIKEHGNEIVELLPFELSLLRKI